MTQRMREPFHTLMHRASTGYNDSWSDVDPEVLEKFGEMIVKRCASIHDAIGNGNTQEGTYDYSEALKRYFGLDK
jgi:hypothetical protein